MKKVIFKFVFLLVFSMLISTQANAQEVKDVCVKTIYIKNISKKFDSKQMFIVKYEEFEFVTYRKYLKKFNKGNIDTLDLSTTTSAAREIQLGVLSGLLIKGKAFFYKMNNDFITYKIFCRYYISEDSLIFADFYLQKGYSYNNDLFVFRYSKYKVALPNRLR